MTLVDSSAPDSTVRSPAQIRHGLRWRSAAGRIVPPLLFSILVLALWEVGAALSGVKESTLPRPSQVAAAMWDARDILWNNAGTTLSEIAVGYIAALALGIALAAAIHASRTVERALYPWLVASQMVPVPAIAPILVLWTGFDIRPKVIVIALVSFFPLVVNTVDGLRAVEPEILNLLRTLGASRWRIFMMAQWPAALPFVFSGMKVAAALSVIGAVFGEWVGSSDGLGYLILTYNNQTATAQVFAVVIVLSIIGIGLFAVVSLLERLLLPWYYEVRAIEQAGRRAAAEGGEP